MATTADDQLVVALLSEHAQPPRRASADAAGYDLYASEPARIPSGGWALVDTGCAVKLPAGTYGRVAPRSGLSVKGVAVGAGVIDRDYRGAIKVLLFNHANEGGDLLVARGDRVAQLILEVIRTPDVCVVASLDETDRGAGGFGSTGTR